MTIVEQDIFFLARTFIYIKLAQFEGLQPSCRMISIPLQREIKKKEKYGT